MTFPEVFPALVAGERIRRDAWGARRAVCLMLEPWNGEREALLMVDRLNRGDVMPFPFSPTGEDMRADDWSACT